MVSALVCAKQEKNEKKEKKEKMRKQKAESGMRLFSLNLLKEWLAKRDGIVKYLIIFIM
jgi:hypothetical protein